MANNNTAIIVIGMVLIVALVMSGPISMGFSNFLSEAWDQWKQLCGQISGATNGTAYSTIGVTIHYADGTTREFKPKPAGIFPLTILDEGEINFLSVEVYCTANMEGTVNSWNLEGFFRATIYQKGTNVLVGYVYNLNFPTASTSGSAWANGESKLMISIDITAIQIENTLEAGSFPEGDYKLKLYSEMTSLSMSFTDGTTDVLDQFYLPKYTITWDFTYSLMGITSVALSISQEPIY